MTASFLPYESAASGFVRVLERLRTWLGVDAPALPLQDAVAALLVHAATLDRPLTPERRTRIASLLRAQLQLDETAAAQALERAAREDRRAVDIHRFVRVINRRLLHEQRLAIFAAVADVTLRDRDGAVQDGFLRLLAGLLGVSDRERATVIRRWRVPHIEASTSNIKHKE